MAQYAIHIFVLSGTRSCPAMSEATGMKRAMTPANFLHHFSAASSHMLFTQWYKAESHAHLVLNQVADDMTDPRYVAAANQSHKALWDFVCNPTSSLHGIALKLKLACHFGDSPKRH